MGFGRDIGLWSVFMNTADEQADELHADEHGWCTSVHLELAYMSLSLNFGWNLMGVGQDIGLGTVLMNIKMNLTDELMSL